MDESCLEKQYRRLESPSSNYRRNIHRRQDCDILRISCPHTLQFFGGNICLAHHLEPNREKRAIGIRTHIRSQIRTRQYSTGPEPQCNSAKESGSGRFVHLFSVLPTQDFPGGYKLWILQDHKRRQPRFRHSPQPIWT